MQSLSSDWSSHTYPCYRFHLIGHHTYPCNRFHPIGHHTLTRAIAFIPLVITHLPVQSLSSDWSSHLPLQLLSSDWSSHTYPCNSFHPIGHHTLTRAIAFIRLVVTNLPVQLLSSDWSSHTYPCNSFHLIGHHTLTRAIAFIRLVVTLGNTITFETRVHADILRFAPEEVGCRAIWI